jgi:hypothetical protein
LEVQRLDITYLNPHREELLVNRWSRPPSVAGTPQVERHRVLTQLCVERWIAIYVVHAEAQHVAIPGDRRIDVTHGHLGEGDPALLRDGRNLPGWRWRGDQLAPAAVAELDRQ